MADFFKKSGSLRLWPHMGNFSNNSYFGFDYSSQEGVAIIIIKSLLKFGTKIGVQKRRKDPNRYTP